MKRLILLIFIAYSAIANACSWGNIHLSYSDSCKKYQFEVSGTGDSCYQVEVKIYKGNVLKATKNDKYFTYNFADTGAYVVRTAIKNNCTNCDTVMYSQIQVSCSTTASSGCNWNNQGIYYTKSNSNCKIYTFEMGSYDTCMKYLTMLYHNGSYDTISDDRVFTYTFADTGNYYIVTKFKNQCTNCDTTIYKLIEVRCNHSNGCNWSNQSIYFNKNNNNCKQYTFEIGSYDSCLKYLAMIYTNSSYDTISDNRVFTHTFADTGNYYLVVKLKNQCTNCDTIIYKLIEVRCNQSNGCDWSKQGIYYNQITSNCKKYIFELGSNDTCVSYTTLSIRDGVVDTLSLSRIFNHVFSQTGYYWIRTSYHNKCTNCDTVIYKQIYVGCDDTCDWSHVGIGFQQHCNKFKFELSNYDTCLIYSTLAIKDNHIDTLPHTRVFDYVFQDTGYYWIRTSYFNKCTNCDTIIYKQIHVECLIASVNAVESSLAPAYPNPAQSFIYLPKEAVNQRYTLYDSRGKLVLEGVGLVETKVDVTDVAEGVYFLSIGNMHQRIVIRRE